MCQSLSLRLEKPNLFPLCAKLSIEPSLDRTAMKPPNKTIFKTSSDHQTTADQHFCLTTNAESSMYYILLDKGN